MDKWAKSIEAVAVHFWGDPTTQNDIELRWGTHGSKTVNLEKGTWYDFEKNEGGGVSHLINREAPASNVAEFLQDVIGWDQQEKTDLEDIICSSKKETIYDYQNEQAELVYQVVRYEPKTFRQRQVINGKTIWNLKGVPLLPYKLPQILNNKEKPVYIVEGEKDVLKLEEYGILATCNSGGSGKWTAEHSKYLKDRDVIVIPDNDEAGEKHGRIVISSLQKFAKSIKLISLPDLKPKEDIFDWLMNNTIQQLFEIIAETQPLSNKPITPIPTLSIEEVIKMPPVPWLIENYIPTNSMAMIYGAPGSGKTFLALDMALHIANGLEWHEKQSKQGSVFYIAGEGVGGLRKRLQAWHIYKNIKPSSHCHIIPQAVPLLEDEAIDNLITTIDQLSNGNTALVVFDTVARCMTGDENSANDMGQAIQAMDKIRNKFNCAVLPIHHSGKDKDRGARGSTAMIGAVDVSLKVDRQENMLALITEKQKDSEAEKVRWFDSKVIELEQTLDLGEESSLVLELSENNIKPQKKMTPAQFELMKALREALGEHGEEPGGKIPGEAVKESIWKEYAFKRTLADSDNTEAKRKAFYRSAKSLKSLGHIEKWGEFVWIKLGQVGQTHGTGLSYTESERKQGF